MLRQRKSRLQQMQQQRQAGRSRGEARRTTAEFEVAFGVREEGACEGDSAAEELSANTWKRETEAKSADR